MARAGPKKTRQYGVAFKRTAVELTRRPGLQVQAVAEALDIHPFMLSRWRKEYREGRLRLASDERDRRTAKISLVREPCVRRSMRTQNKDAVPKRSLTIGAVVNVLREHYGPPLSLPTADPFELILWENVAYLAPPARRRQAFEQLKRTVGTSPEAILTAKQSALERVTARGILKSTFAAKLRDCASITVHEFGGDLGAVIHGPLDSAKRALRLFPGIGEPGAEKILLFTGQQALLAPDSNGLRVLRRLGLVREEKKSYSRTYAASRQVANDLPKEPSVMQEAHLLLQQHGQSLCKRGVPRCEQCPLTLVCAYARMTHGAPNERLQPTKAPRTKTAQAALRERLRG